MAISAPKTNEATAVNVRCSNDMLTAELADGRVVSAPLSWYPRLVHATQAERDNWQLEGDGDAIRWPDLDEDILVEALLVGWPSRESEKSFNHWLKAKQEGRGLTIPELRAYEESQKQQTTDSK